MSRIQPNTRVVPRPDPGGLLLHCCGYGAIRHMFAAILLFAACMKAYTTATDPLLRAGLRESLFLPVVVVSIEILLAFWLFSSLWAEWAYRVSLAMLAIFVVASSYHLLSGDATCGCFGKLKIHPAWTLALDLSLAVALWRGGLNGVAGQRHVTLGTASVEAKRVPWLLSLAICAILVAILWMTGVLAVVVYGHSLVRGNLKVLEPEKWVGLPFPVLADINCNDKDAATAKLSDGKWLAVFYHNDCRECQLVIPRVVTAAHMSDTLAGSLRYIFIEITPAQDSHGHDHPGVQYDQHCLRATLNQRYEWLVQTPTFVWLSDGIVSRTSRNWP